MLGERLGGQGSNFPPFLAKPPRAPSGKSSQAPPIPARPSPAAALATPKSPKFSESSDSPSRPPTSASTSSFTPSYVTPPQSPNHNVVVGGKFWAESELDLGEQVRPDARRKRGFFRLVTVTRSGGQEEFGFSVRKASGAGGGEPVLFAEPCQSLIGGRDFGDGFLLPGDRLVAINNIGVESRSRDEAVEMIRAAQGTLSLKVQSACHWIENIEAIRHEREEEGYNNGAGGNVWLVHRSGFARARILESIDETGRVKVELDTGQMFVVSEDDVEQVRGGIAY